jgi:hypothetical protein
VRGDETLSSIGANLWGEAALAFEFAGAAGVSTPIRI